MADRHASRGPTRGFTLTELVVILVIIGALAAFAAPRLNISGFDEYTFRTEVVNALRFAQKTATASRCEVQVVVDADRLEVRQRGGGTSLECGDAAFDELMRHPSRGGDFVVEARRDAAITGGTGTVVFDPRGAADTGLTLTFASGRTVVVEAGTGYVDA